LRVVLPDKKLYGMGHQRGARGHPTGLF